jgi:hypothetical protein
LDDEGASVKYRKNKVTKPYASLLDVRRTEHAYKYTTAGVTYNGILPVQTIYDTTLGSIKKFYKIQPATPITDDHPFVVLTQPISVDIPDIPAIIKTSFEKKLQGYLIPVYTLEGIPLNIDE